MKLNQMINSNRLSVNTIGNNGLSKVILRVHYYYGYSEPMKRKSDFTIEEWEKYQVISMDLVKDDSEYVGGNKEMALYALFEGHKFGLQRFEKQGEAK